MKKILLLTMLVLIGCKKAEKGDKGDAGVQGLRGPGTIEILSGLVTSNDFTVTDSRIRSSSQITVYLSDSSGTMAEMPYFLPGAGVNAYYLATPLTSRIEIINGQTALASSYIIVLII